MKKSHAVYFILFFSSLLFAQRIPSDYSIGEKRLSKISDQTPISNTIERIFVNNNLILLATSKGMSKSTDNGESWTNYGNEVFGGESVSSVGYYNGTIWAGTWHPQNVSGSIIGVGSGLKYTTDSGTTWNEIDQPLDKTTDTVMVYGDNRIKTNPTTVPQENFIYDIAFTSGSIWYVAKAGGLRKSQDMGKTWQKILLPPDNLDSIKPADVLTFKYDPAINLNHRAFSILTIDDNTILVGTAGGINKSTDGGVSWIKFNHTNQANPISGNYIWALEKNDYDNSIWAATWKAEGQTEFWGVSVSRDGGDNWAVYLSGEKARDFGFKYSGPTDNYSGAEIFAASETGVYRSANNGITWIAAPEIRDDNTNVGLNTEKFFAVKVNRRENNSADIWLGSDNGLARLNETSGFWSGDWKVFLASEKLASASETYAFPNPFSPDAEGVKIKYKTSGQADVTVRIFDFGMNLVRTVIQNATRSAESEHLELWNGKDESGKIVPNGVYFYRIDLGDSAPLFGKIMVLM
ncbi:MAG: hypothetical protein WC061_06305 [Melioribacteraceae bacterium]